MSKQPRLRKDGAYTLVCNVCGGKFAATDKRQGYCSPECYDQKDYAPKFEPLEVVALRNKPSVRLNCGHRIFNIFERDGFQCAYCGRSSIEHGVVLHADHIHPRARGGPDTAENLITSCVDCNTSKAARVLDEDTMRVLIARARRANAERGIPHESIYAVDKYSSDRITING
jgi:hypothetical protein